MENVFAGMQVCGYVGVAAAAAAAVCVFYVRLSDSYYAPFLVAMHSPDSVLQNYSFLGMLFYSAEIFQIFQNW